ncbi:MAG: cation diffusion facilitator family transporter [Candidatus Adiutrix sp.]|jgi:cation diffusion facilitator family transporter|nr:cation diffusion facilitator family transporter [Candidatus Adiutrix sp.]
MIKALQLLFGSHQAPDEALVKSISQVTWVGLWVNLALIVAKGLGGWWAGSRTLLADAVHSLSDLITDGAVLVGVRYWAAPADADHPYGHGKIETLVTLVIALALALVGVSMAYGSLAALYRAAAAPATKSLAATTATWAALGVALVSIASKEFLYRWTAARGAALKSSALVANAWHHRSDALSSIPPVITIGAGAAGARQGHDLWFLDPVGTVVVAVMLIAVSFKMARPALSTLLDASAGRRLSAAIREAAAATPGVLSGHKLRTRFLGPDAAEVNLHILVDGGLTVADGHRIAADVKYRLLALTVPGLETRIVDVLIHLEPGESE